MATARSGYLVILSGRIELVLNETDAKTYPGRISSFEVLIVPAEVNGDFYIIDTLRGVMTFDKTASDARKALRIAARGKLTVEERAACGLTDQEVV